MEQNQSVTDNYSNCLTPGTDSADYSVYAGRLAMILSVIVRPCSFHAPYHCGGDQVLEGYVSVGLFLNLPFCQRRAME